MPPSSHPVFGKRAVDPRPKRRLEPTAAPTIPDAAAVFAEARREIAASDERPREVPRSFGAALLAGLVVGFCLAGLDITHAGAISPALEPLLKSGVLGLGGDTRAALPYMIALSLVSGARVAATTLLIAHRLLAAAGQSGFTAYALGGAALSAVYAALLVGFGHPPAHGWVVDIAAGGGAGFFYRMFAGARPG